MTPTDMNRPQQSHSPSNRSRDNHPRENQSQGISQEIINEISRHPYLRDYDIRSLVKHAEKFGPFLRNRRLETNQIRKFLDAINRLKAQLNQGDTGEDAPKDSAALFAEIETDIVLLKPKLAYSAARQESAKPLSEVMSVAIDRVHSLKDFERLVQLIESIIAYHKAEGGR